MTEVVQSADPVSHSFEIEIEPYGNHRIAAWIYPPRYPPDVFPVVWCFDIPGGTYRGKAYYDRQVPGYVNFSFSFARHLASQGIGHIVIDNLGTGESSRGIPSEKVNAALLTKAYTQVVAQIREGLQNKTLVEGLPAIPSESLLLAGVGHSMGDFILTHLQATQHPFDVVVKLGMPYQEENVRAFMSNSNGDAQALLAEFRKHADDEEFARATRPYFRHVFYSDRVPRALIDIDEAEATITPLGLFTDVFSDMAEAAKWASNVVGPVFIGFGEKEIPNPRAEVQSYASSFSINLRILAGAAHCNFFDPNRTELWGEIAAWLRAKAASMKLPITRY